MMGYFAIKPKIKSEDIWGDEPADIIDEAIKNIFKVFKEDMGRIPTKYEMEEGFRMSLDSCIEYDED